MKWRKGDFVAIAVVILLAIGIWAFPFGREEAASVDIFCDGKLVYTSSVAMPFETEVAGCSVKFSDGKVRVVSSTCPDKVCVKTGDISEAGEVIVCVPNRVSIKLAGKKEFDAVVN